MSPRGWAWSLGLVTPLWVGIFTILAIVRETT